MASRENSNQPWELDVTAIVISYNSEDRIARAVRAHNEALSHLRSEVIVVDNASSDRSVEAARGAVGNGRVIANSENVGYGAAANQGIQAARGAACLILNDDARLAPGAIDTLLEVLWSAPEIALVGPRIVDEDGLAMPSARLVFPGPDEELRRLKDVVRGVNRNRVYPIDGDDPADVAWLVAACVLGRTQVLRAIGGFNPEFFLYSEDIDLSRRLKELGYRVMTVPTAVCIHTGSVSTGATFGNRKSIDRRAKARDIYYRLWYPRPIRSLIHLRRAIGLSNQPQRLMHHLPRVIWDGSSLRDRRLPPPLGDDGETGQLE
jgi:GT2 family glycosyltransferase